MMAVRLMEMHRPRLETSTGSIYLHCDPTASHYLKLLMDAIWGSQRFMPPSKDSLTSLWYYMTQFGPIVHSRIALRQCYIPIHQRT